jgi:hypothetical protein
MKETTLRQQIRTWVVFFIIGIALSGITAFPIVTEVQWLNDHINLFPGFLIPWIKEVYTGVTQTSAAYPFMAYGTDWLAFAHLIIALLFIGVLRNPVRNVWVVDWAMLCCLLVLPLALIAGPVRGIPFFHRLIDCSFGVIGIIPLLIVRKKINQLKKLQLDSVVI